MERDAVKKQQKSKEELRAMIIEKARQSQRFPPGMDVSIRATARGWGVDCLPPTASHNGFVEICDDIATIALSLRDDFDLKPT